MANKYLDNAGLTYLWSKLKAAFVPQTRKVNNKALSSDITLSASDVNALPLSGGTMNDGASITLSTYGTRKVVLTGNSISADMSAETGGWAGNFASVKDPAGDTTPMLGWYGGTSGLTHIYMGGTYSDPYMKMTKAGQFTFKNTPKVGSTNVALTTDVAALEARIAALETRIAELNLGFVDSEEDM